MNKILIAHGNKKKLYALACHVTVRRALNGEIDTELAKRIRKAALENGGCEVLKSK